MQLIYGHPWGDFLIICHVAQEDRMLFQGAQKLFGMASWQTRVADQGGERAAWWVVVGRGRWSLSLVQVITLGEAMAYVLSGMYGPVKALAAQPWRAMARRVKPGDQQGTTDAISRCTEYPSMELVINTVHHWPLNQPN